MSTASSEFVIDVDGRDRAVHVHVHPRAKLLRLRYDPVADALKLVVPPRASMRSARAWTLAQTDWIRRQIAQAPAPSWVAPAVAIPWDGATLLIDWAADRPRAPALVTADDDWVLHIGGPQCGVGARVGRWLKDFARADFTERTHRLAAQAGLRCVGVSVGDPRSRWGSCTAQGRIRYSWRIAMAPTFVREALAGHEVAHLAHMNHGPDFHALVASLVGAQADASRLWLRQHGRALHDWRFSRPLD